VVLPVAIGVTFRTRFEGMVLANLDRCRRVSLVLLAGLIILIAAPAPGILLQQCWAMIVPAILISVSLLGAGYAVGRIARLPWTERTAVMFEFPCRNLAVVALVGLNILDQPELAIFATGFFLVQSVMMVPAAWAFARVGNRAERTNVRNVCPSRVAEDADEGAADVM
jgi:predicted Na+-dependent transporter